MPGQRPAITLSLSTNGATAAPWEEARRRLEQAELYFLGTVHPDGRPHMRPVLAVWADGALHFAAGPASRKARNVAHDTRCSITTDCEGAHLVLEGRATKVTDEAGLRSIADMYASKYKWPVTVRDGAFHDTEGAPTAGPPPYEVYRVTPATVFGFGAADWFTPTRWRF